MASIISAGTTSGTALNMAGDTSGVLELATNGSTTAITIDTSQNVGIGTSSPSFKVDVIGSSTPTLRIDDGAGNETRTAGRLLLGSSSTLGVAIENNVVGFNDVCSMVFKTTPATGTLTERMRIDSTGNLLFNSGYGSVATAYGCRAWVNFNGTGTPAIRASGNVSSITDNGTGDYAVNFTIAMPDANYGAVASSQRDVSTDQVGTFVTNSNASSVKIVELANLTFFDSINMAVAVFR
jgi:hypothetical protein